MVSKIKPLIKSKIAKIKLEELKIASGTWVIYCVFKNSSITTPPLNSEIIKIILEKIEKKANGRLSR